MRVTLKAEAGSHRDLLLMLRDAVSEIEHGQMFAGHRGPDGRWDFELQISTDDAEVRDEIRDPRD